MKRKQRERAQNALRDFAARIDGRSLAIGLVIGLLVTQFINYLTVDATGFLQNLVPEFVGLIFTVLILDNLGQMRERRNMIEQLIRRMHSRYNHTALAAIEELRVLGKLSDGTLQGRELRGSNWRDANLYQADLRHCDLRNAEFLHADLVEANLEHANVTEAQLASTDIMCGAIMPDGSRYDGRYNLEGDFAYARRKNVDLSSPEQMAAFYGVSVGEYMAGQTWWAMNKDRFTKRARHYDMTDMRNQPLQ
jgi:hypothetical protein